MEEKIEVKYMNGVYERIRRWMVIDENDIWDMEDMYGLDMIGVLNEKRLVEELKMLREEIEVMKRVVENVEIIEKIYYEEYVKRGEE